MGFPAHRNVVSPTTKLFSCRPKGTGVSPSKNVPDKYIMKHKPLLETKASSHQGQCISAGCRVTLPRTVLITMSIITTRSRLFLANSASDSSRFLKFRPQFCESCGTIYRQICELFSAVQSTSGPVTDDENSFQIDA